MKRTLANGLCSWAYIARHPRTERLHVMSYSHMCLRLQFRQVEKRVFSRFQENKIRWNTKRLIKHTNQLKREWKIHRIKRKRKIKTHTREKPPTKPTTTIVHKKNNTKIIKVSHHHIQMLSVSPWICICLVYTQCARLCDCSHSRGSR